MSPIRSSRENPIHRAGARARRSSPRRDGTTATTISRRRRGSAPTSTPAPARPTSFPAALEVMFNFRFCPVSSRESLEERFEALLARHGARLRARLDRIRRAVPHARAAAGRRRDATRCATVTGIAPGALLHRRHFGRTLHRGHLPRGRRARSGQRHDPQGERTRARRTTSARWQRSISVSSSACSWRRPERRAPRRGPQRGASP